MYVVEISIISCKSTGLWFLYREFKAKAQYYIYCTFLLNAILKIHTIRVKTSLPAYEIDYQQLFQ